MDVAGCGDAFATVVAASGVASLRVFDICGFTVFGIPLMFDSVVLIGLRFDSGLLRSHIAAFCSGVDDDCVDVVLSSWPWAATKCVNPINVTAIALIKQRLPIQLLY